MIVRHLFQLETRRHRDGGHVFTKNIFHIQSLMPVSCLFIYFCSVVTVTLSPPQYNLHDHPRPQLRGRGGALGQRLPGPGAEIPAGQRGHQPVAVSLQLLGQERPAGQPQPPLQAHQQHEVPGSRLWLVRTNWGGGPQMLIMNSSNTKFTF